jgi:prolyl oligopeptidase
MRSALRSLLAFAALTAPLAVRAQSPVTPATTSAPLLDLPSTDPAKPDPFAWLEDIHSPRALAWVEAENKRTAARLESDPRYEVFRKQALALFTAKDRVPFPSFLGKDIDNLWQDDAHTKGLWRRATSASYASADPKWETLIDLDALSKAEGKNWLFHGANCLQPEERLCLVSLSNGGGDAVEIREFDTQAKQFVPGGFHFDKGKQDVAWLDADTLLVSRDWGPDAAGNPTLTQSGYPFVLKLVKRGQPLDQAVEIYRGTPKDVRVDARVLRDEKGAVAVTLIAHGVGFFSTEYFDLSHDGAIRPLDLPRKIELHGYVAGRLILTPNEDWPANAKHSAFKAGALVAYDPESGAADLITQPGPTQAIDAVRVTKDRVLVSLLDNVNGAIDVYAPPGGPRVEWFPTRLAFPKGLALSIRAADHGSDRAFIATESFLEPTALWSVNAATGQIAKVKALPPRFDASKDVTEQHFATSKDGTKIPYFLVRPKAMKYDGTTPVQMFGYGGFQLSETPSYRPEVGKLWLERGGAYVLANIRGGGEYGPKWHEAALREHRQRAFDDFDAIAKDLFVTSPRHMGIYARSNGGILTTVSMTQHPEDFNAVVVESPLIDMLRYNHLSAGASWMAEYGDPDKPEDRAFIAKYSAYTALRPGVKYPEPYITTNTEDDRVHPGHPRKFAAELKALGDPYLYYENTFGGHANDADPELNARRWARHYVYLSQKLMDGGE